MPQQQQQQHQNGGMIQQPQLSTYILLDTEIVVADLKKPNEVQRSGLKNGSKHSAVYDVQSFYRRTGCSEEQRRALLKVRRNLECCTRRCNQQAQLSYLSNETNLSNDTGLVSLTRSTRT